MCLALVAALIAGAAGPVSAQPADEPGAPALPEEISRLGRLVQRVLDMIARWETVLTVRSDRLAEDILRPLVDLREPQRVLTALSTHLQRFARLLERAERRAVAPLEQVPGASGGRSLLKGYGAGNPALGRRAEAMAAGEMAAVAGAVHAAASGRASMAMARYMAANTRLARQVRQARVTAAALRRSATGLPSTRAAMQVMIVGQAATLQHQVRVGHALGERLGYLGQEVATLSQQAAAMETTLARQLLTQTHAARDDLAGTLVQIDLIREAAVQTFGRGARPFLALDPKEEEGDLLQLVRWRVRPR